MATEFGTRTRIASDPAFAGILKDDEVYATSDEGLGNQVNGWFDNLMIQSGTGILPSMMLGICLLVAITLGGFAFVIPDNPNFLAVALATLIGFIGPLGIVMNVRTRRQTRLMEQMPAMLDELARAAKTGRSLDHCYEFVAENTPAPLGDELRLCARQMQMGIDLGTALRVLPQRTGLVTLNLLVTALTVHQQLGGDLVMVLDRLSETIRDRLLFLGRLRAATTSSRATSILMITLPLAIFTFLQFRDPLYFEKLFSSTWGRGLTITAVVLQIVGAVWVLRILKSSQQA